MLDEIILDVIDSVRAAKLKEAAKATTNRYLALMRSILLRARDEWEWIDKAPKVRLFKESASRERSLTREQAGKQLDELPQHQRDVLLFARATGLRQSNVQLEWSQINLEQRHAWIHAWQSKNRRPICIPLNEAAYALLIWQQEKHESRVFTFHGEPLNTADTRAWRKAFLRGESITSVGMN